MKIWLLQISLYFIITLKAIQLNSIIQAQYILEKSSEL